MLNHKGLAKDHTWVKFSASTAASTNQILIEDVLQEVIKVKKASNQRHVK